MENSRLSQRWLVGVSTFIFSGAILSIVQIKTDPAQLVLERFLPGAGWAEAFVLALYGGWLSTKMLDPAFSAKWRSRIWLAFSIVFFTQLFLGIAGIEQFLLTGKLHLPLPALILADPLYRDGLSIFMPILFLVSMLLLGPAWCSHLCYIGPLDNFAAKQKPLPGPIPKWIQKARIGILVLMVVCAVALRFSGLSVSVAFFAASAFGIIGLVIMAVWSRKTGVMTHCTFWCPMGLLANWLGRLSPFRIRIGNECTQCGMCATRCRFNALSPSDIEQKRPAIGCTLCGDCESACENSQIGYHFLGLSKDSARALFIFLVVSAHTLFLGLAKI